MNFEAAKSFILTRLQNELPASLAYHNVDHVKDVYESAERLALLEGVNEEDRLLLLTAVLYHDAGFLKQPEEHEEISCTIAGEHLPRFSYTPLQIDRICSLIKATKVPQNPQNHLEQIICDADLDYLGRDDFGATANKLFTELKHFGIVQTENEWNTRQVAFFEKHHYFTNTAIRLRQLKKDKHLGMIKQMILHP